MITALLLSATLVGSPPAGRMSATADPRWLTPDRVLLLRNYIARLNAADYHTMIPSYSRQTGLACSACHTAFPMLNSFGRRFKLNGYTLTGLQNVQGDTAKGETMRLPLIPPFSAMVQTSFSQTRTTVPGTQNGELEFPQAVSVFVGGAISPHLGSFIQMTYDGISGGFGLDMAEVRYARHALLGGKELLFGAVVNNNPGLQDVWNSVPAWRFPFASSGVAPTPGAAALAEGALSQQVAGIGAYGLWNNLLYGEYSAYRSAAPGGPHPADSTATNTIEGVASYWRSYLQHSWNQQTLMVGTFGMSARLFPNGVSGDVNRYRDLAVDAQYERSVGSGSLSAHGSWLHERQQFDAAVIAGTTANTTNSLNTLHLDASLLTASRLGFTLGYFAVSGTSDTLQYQPAPIVGSAAGLPDSRGILGEVSMMPWQNTRFALQYVAYSKFNGATSNYDGAGRNASDNNVLYLLGWFVF